MAITAAHTSMPVAALENSQLSKANRHDVLHRRNEK